MSSLRVFVRCSKTALEEEAERVVEELDLDRVPELGEADIAVTDVDHIADVVGGDRAVVVLAETEDEADDAADSGVNQVALVASPRALRRAMIAACRESEQIARQSVMRGVLDNVAESVEITGKDGELVYVNPAFTRMFGFTSEEALGRSPAELMRSDVHDVTFFEGMWDAAVQGDLWHGEMVGRRKDGTLVSELSTISGTLVGGRPRFLFGIKQPLGTPLDEELKVDNIARLRGVLARVRASERRFQTMVDAVNDAVFIADLESAHILYANRAALRMYGYTLDEFRRMKGRELSQPSQSDTVGALSAAINKGEVGYIPRYLALRKDGTTFWASIRTQTYDVGERGMYVAVVRDEADLVAREIELETAEVQILNNERLASIGQLAASVAHEINNPATYVMLNLGFLAEMKFDDPEARHWLDDCIEGMGRIERVAKQLLVVTRLEPANVVDTDCNQLVQRCAKLAENFIRHRAELVLELADVPTIAADSGRLSQVITNLLVNAAQAIEAGSADDNRITVTTRMTGDNVLLSVRDTGTGIAEGVLDHIFDPFFTTKKKGEGTGLGLSVCAEIVRTHGGEILVESEPGRGTEVTVRLPVETGLVADGSEPPTPEASVALPRLRVMIVDDEVPLLKALGRRFGKEHDLCLLSFAEDALAKLEDDPNWDAIVCDLMMPNMDGPTLYERACAMTPGLARRFIFCTGGVFTTRAREFADNTLCPVLHKPVSPVVLSEAIQQVALTFRSERSAESEAPATSATRVDSEPSPGIRGD